MNYLAHLHIAEIANSNKLGNLLGDFVKGNPDQQYSAEIAAGIRLHRHVDSYTDQHDICKHASALFSKQTRRFAPIALDMFWDHCLASHWERHHEVPLNQFCHLTSLEIQNDIPDHVPNTFVAVNQRLWQQKWIESYAHFENIEFALQRMSQRRPRLAALRDTTHDLVKHYQTFEQLFPELYSDVLISSVKHQQTLIDSSE